MNKGADASLVRISELAESLADTAQAAPPVLIDVRWVVGSPPQHSAYLAGHIPTAHFCDLDADLADPPGAKGRHPLPDPMRLQQRMRSWGIDADSTVVAYDGGSSIAAARAWWVLRWAGLERVRVLDGGLAAWTRAGLRMEVGAATPAAGTFQVRPGSLPSLDATTAGSWAAQGRLVDVRAPERFRGESEPIDPVAGHIPGARNLPIAANLAPNGTFKSAAELAIEFAGVARSSGHPEPLGVYCGSGVTAAQTMLAMHEAGIDAVLYPGSWSEWITDPSRPIATG
ncbi:sulfurtransferase [Jatrophihabitans sp. DSM 45814]